MAGTGMISPAQAAALLPLLAKIAATPGSPMDAAAGQESPYTPSSSGSTSSNLASSSGTPNFPHFGYESGESSGFSSSELLSKKKRNSHSSEAQKYMHYCLRESCKAAGLWDTAPFIDEIGHGPMNLFFSKMKQLCPQVSGSRKQVRALLSSCLMNRCAYLKRKKRFRSVRNPSPKARRQRHVPSIKPRVLMSSAARASSYTPGEEVDILYKDECIGIGMFVIEENEMYSRIMITNIPNAVRKRKGDHEIPLPSVTLDGRKHFHELRVKDIVSWRTSNLRGKLKNDKGLYEQDSSESSGEETDSEDESSSADESGIDDSLSAYEKMIMENKKALQKKKEEIMGNFLLHSESEPASTSGKKRAKTKCKSGRVPKVQQSPTKRSKLESTSTSTRGSKAKAKSPVKSRSSSTISSSSKTKAKSPVKNGSEAKVKKQKQQVKNGGTTNASGSKAKPRSPKKNVGSSATAAGIKGKQNPLVCLKGQSDTSSDHEQPVKTPRQTVENVGSTTSGINIKPKSPEESNASAASSSQVTEDLSGPVETNVNKSPKKRKYYEYVSDSDFEENDIFAAEVVSGKRMRKPNKLYTD